MPGEKFGAMTAPFPARLAARATARLDGSHPVVPHTTATPAPSRAITFASADPGAVNSNATVAPRSEARVIRRATPSAPPPGSTRATTECPRRTAAASTSLPIFP